MDNFNKIFLGVEDQKIHKFRNKITNPKMIETLHNAGH